MSRSTGDHRRTSKLFLLFRMEGDRYALDAREVVEVLPLLRLKRIPEAPEWVAGVFSHRGVLVPVLDLCGVRLALGWYAAVSLLSLLLAPDREAALLFLFLGYYPVVQPYFARIPVRALRPCAKLLLFNAAVLLLYGLVCGLLGIPAASDGSAVLLAVMLLLGNVTFFLYDIVIARLTRLWKRRKKRWNL